MADAVGAVAAAAAEQDRAGALRVDAWIQHPTPGFVQHPMFASLRRWIGADSLPDEFPIEWTVGALEAADMDIGLVSAWYGPNGPLISNDDVASFIAQAPKRLRGVGSVDLRRPMEAVREVRRCVYELGFVAIRVLPWLWDAPPSDARYYPVYVACVEAGVPFCLQVGHAGPLAPSEPGRPIPYLDRVALDFPELTIVGGHVGYPWTEEMIALATKYENVFIDTSAYTVRRLPESLIRFARAHGREKVLFGSNYPMIPPSKALDGLETLGFDDDARRLFLGDNAVRVFSLS